MFVYSFVGICMWLFVIKSYSARNNQAPDKICRGFVFMRITAIFSPQGYQYVQRSYQIIEYPHRLHTMAKTRMSKKNKTHLSKFYKCTISMPGNCSAIYSAARRRWHCIADFSVQSMHMRSREFKASPAVRLRVANNSLYIRS